MTPLSLFDLAREFDRDRRARELALQRALDAYCLERPELLKARKAWARSRVSRARSALYGQAGTSDEDRERFENLLRETLVREGKDPERFVFRPSCPLCGDTGVTEDGAFCVCLRKAYADRLKREGNVDPELSFGNWNDERFFAEAPEGQRSEREYMIRLREVLVRWAEEAGSGGRRGLLLVGGTGCGKTFALHSVANLLCDRGFSAVVTRAFELNRQAASTFDTDWQVPYIACDFLAIDDLGAEPMYRKITAELFYAVLESRRSVGKPTAFATNLTPDELEERYGSRFFSRLIDRESTLSLALPGHDLRRDRT